MEKKLYELARGEDRGEKGQEGGDRGDQDSSDPSAPGFHDRNLLKGTYIRTLCHDIGQKLGCGGCMEELLRTRVGRFPLEDSLKLAEIEILMGLGQLQEHLIAVDSLFSEYPAVTVKGGVSETSG